MNFSEEEKNLVLSLAAKHKDIIQHRSNEADIIRAKERAWNDIAAKYNANHIVQIERSPQELKKLLQNMRTKARKKLESHGEVMEHCPDIDTLKRIALANGSDSSHHLVPVGKDCVVHLHTLHHFFPHQVHVWDPTTPNGCA